MSTIVVGVDSSKGSQRAVRWAVEEAKLRNATLELVNAYPTPEVVSLPTVMAFPTEEELQDWAVEAIDEVIAAIGGIEDVPVVRTARPGGAANVLCEIAERADLLVVGARGLGGFRGMLLGSVTHQVVSQSRTPVVVVMPDDR